MSSLGCKPSPCVVHVVLHVVQLCMLYRLKVEAVDLEQMYRDSVGGGTCVRGTYSESMFYSRNDLLSEVRI